MPERGAMLFVHTGLAGDEQGAKKGGLAQVEIVALRFRSTWTLFDRSAPGSGVIPADETLQIRRAFTFRGKVVDGNPEFETIDDPVTGTLRWQRGASQRPLEATTLIISIEEEMWFEPDESGHLPMHPMVRGWGYLTTKPAPV